MLIANHYLKDFNLAIINKFYSIVQFTINYKYLSIALSNLDFLLNDDENAFQHFIRKLIQQIIFINQIIFHFKLLYSF